MGNLNPCPFCGWEPPDAFDDDGAFYVECEYCWTSGPFNVEGKDKAIEDWNRLVVNTEKLEEVKRLLKNSVEGPPIDDLNRDEGGILHRANPDYVYKEVLAIYRILIGED